MAKNDDMKPPPKIQWKGSMEPADVAAANLGAAERQEEERQRLEKLREEKLQKDLELDTAAAAMFIALKDHPRCKGEEMGQNRKWLEEHSYDFAQFMTSGPKHWLQNPPFYLLLADQYLKQLDAIADKVLRNIVSIISLDDQRKLPVRRQKTMFLMYVTALRLYEFDPSKYVEYEVRKEAFDYREMRRLAGEVIPLRRK